MKRECILHIGMHKTGSTSLQAVLQSMEPNDRICYFDFGHPNHTERIVSLFAKNRICLAHQKMGWSRERIERFKAETRRLFDENVARCPAERMILSGEGIIGLETEELEALREFLSRYFTEVTVFAYVRKPGEYLESYFQELVKLGTGEFVVERIFPKYRTLFEKFDRVFGRERVTLRVFDRNLLKGGDVVTDFFDWCGIDTPRKEETVRSNESLSKEALSLLYIYRKFGPGYGRGPEVIRENNRMIAALKAIEGEKLRFSSELVARIFARHRKEIEWIERRLGVSWRADRESSPTAIDSERDLLEVSDGTFAALERIAGRRRGDSPSGDRTRRICTLLHALRKPRTAADRGREGRSVDAGELALRLRRQYPDALSGIGEKRLRFLVGRVINEMRELLMEQEREVPLRIRGLGEFALKKRARGQRLFVLKTNEEGSKHRDG